MRRFNIGSAMFALAAAAVISGVAAPHAGMAGAVDTATLGGRHKGKGRNNRRGKGAQAKQRKRPNMQHVAKRVRRKHRRQAA